MKHLTMTCARSPLQWLTRLACVSAALLLIAVSAQAETAILPAIGGVGGGQFMAPCADGRLLAGFELRAGDDIDAIRPLCVIALEPRWTSPVQLTRRSGLITVYKSPLGDKYDIVKLESGWNGGTGGHLTSVVCPSDRPIVTGMYVAAEGIDTITVNNIHLFCGLAARSQAPSDLPSAIFDAPDVTRDRGYTNDTQRCPGGLVAVGMHGRSGVWVDAMGLICGEPRFGSLADLLCDSADPLERLRCELEREKRRRETPVKAIGRTRVEGPSGAPRPAGAPRPICEVAREARARNSPAAPGLEAQCRAAGAAGELPPVNAVGRVKLPSSGGAPSVSSLSICEAARAARARNSPAAPGLEAQCRAVGETPAVDVNDLAARGEAIANQDPLAVELRGREPEGPVRRGFDIGMAAAEGHTAPGPGKQKIHDSLSPAEQGGFETAVAFSLERNRNKDNAAIGAAVAAADPLVAEARTVDADVFYWLGFDIASGLFGDPALDLGAKGRTAMGPDSLQIRDSLSAAGQRGFNASVELHLSRHYQP